MKRFQLVSVNNDNYEVLLKGYSVVLVEFSD